jgi:hypothetical protein
MYKQIFIYLFRVLLLAGSAPVSEEPFFVLIFVVQRKFHAQNI